MFHKKLALHFDYVGVNAIAEGLQKLLTSQIKEKRKTPLPQGKAAICCFPVQKPSHPSHHMLSSATCAGFAGALGAKLKERSLGEEKHGNLLLQISRYSQSPLSPLLSIAKVHEKREELSFVHSQHSYRFLRISMPTMAIAAIMATVEMAK
ncbi:MAG: hypothetical protein QXZ70_08200 [Candidatus Bathyarchaeia archaeon]